MKFLFFNPKLTYIDILYYFNIFYKEAAFLTDSVRSKCWLVAGRVSRKYLKKSNLIKLGQLGINT